MRRILGLMVTALLILGIFLWSFDVFGGARIAPDDATMRPGRPYDGPAVTASLESIIPHTEAVGTVQARERAAVSSELLATVRAVHVGAGEPVEAGQLVVELDDRDERTRVQQAEETVRSSKASLTEAERDVKRFSDLYAQKAATERDLDQARTRQQVAAAEYARAQEALREAEVALSQTMIRAPVAGVVVDKLVDSGDLAAPGKPLLNIYNPNLLRLEVNVRTALLPRLHVGDSVSVHIDDLDATVEGVLSEVVPLADAASRSVLVKVALPAKGGLYVGMFGRLRIPLEAEEQLVLPRNVIQQVGQLTMVDVVADGHLMRRLVTLGRTYGDRVQILSGLQVGERIATP